MDNFDDMPDTDDWCKGGCDHYKNTVEGMERYHALGKTLKEKTYGTQK